MIGFYAAGAMGVEPTPTDGYPVLLSITSFGDANVTTHVVTLPTTSNGDLLVIVFGRGGSTRDVVMPSPWVDVVAETSTSPDVRAFYLVCDGTEGGTTVNVTMSASARPLAWAIHRFQSGTWSGVPEAVRGAATSTSSPNPPSLTPSWGSAKTFWIAAACTAVEATASSYPFADGHVAEVSSSNTTLFSCWSKQEAGSVDPAAFSLSAAATSVGATIAVRPA